MEPQVSTQPQPSSTTAGYHVRLGTHTDPGRVREDNEDSLRVFSVAERKSVCADGTYAGPLDHAGLLLMVADGMGGMSGGEQASGMCTEIVPDEFIRRLGSSAPTREQVRSALAEAVREANRRILERATAEVKLRGMGCTLTSVLLDSRTGLIAQVGDSRAYLGRGGEVTQLTLDQTVWESLRAQGKDPEQALGSSQFKSMLLQAVGAQEDVKPELTELELQPGDWLVLCTDGLYRVVTPEDIREILKAESGPAEKARALTALANQNGGPDNVSVIVCQVTAQGGLKAAA